jgi:hypothetical protein
VRLDHSRAFVSGACVLGLLVSSCRGERPAPPPGAESSPPASLRPLTSRDGAGRPEAGAPSLPETSLPPGHPPIGGTAPAAAAEGGAVAGTIAVVPSLQSRAAGGVLFVIARSGADRRIVAVRREDGVTFPFKFRISGADAMTAGTTFAGPLEITARLSKSGDAVASKGDLAGVAKGIAVGATDVKVTIDTVHE